MSSRKTDQLWKGRNSIPGARYFVTICTLNKENQLLEPSISDHIFDQLKSQNNDQDFELHCATIMSDHLHLVLRLGSRLTIGQIIAKFKSKTKHSIQWQRDFFEHKIRPDESEENYAFYIFMNPYAADICNKDEKWRFWRRWRNTPYQFEELLSDTFSIPEKWIRDYRESEDTLQVG